MGYLPAANMLSPVALRGGQHLARVLLTRSSGIVMQRRFKADIMRSVGDKIRQQYVQHPWLISGLPTVPSLSAEDRLLTFIAGNTAAGNLNSIQRDWCYLTEDIHDKGTEAILQCLAYAGVPRTLNAFSTVRKMGIAKTCVLDPVDARYESKDQSGMGDLADTMASRFDKGIDTMKLLLGDGYAGMRKNTRMLHPAYDRWTVEFLYGRLMNRGVMTMRQRMLCALMSMTGGAAFPQLKTVIYACLKAGASMADVRGVLDQTQLIWGATAQRAVDALWADFNIKRFEEQWLSGHMASDRNIELIWDYHGDTTMSTRVATEVWKKFTYEADDKVLAPPTTRHTNHPFLADLPRRRGSPDDITRILCMIVANVNSGNLTALARDWSYLPPHAHKMGMEALLQTALFAGFPKCWNALVTVYQVGVCRDAIDFADQDKIAMDNVTSHPNQFFHSGIDLLGQIYTKTKDGLRTNLRKGHPDLETIIIEFVYGRVLSRPVAGFTAKHRELLTLACLTGPPIVFPQLHSHLLGALNVGASMDDIRCILDQTGLVWGNEAQALVDGFWLDFEGEVRMKNKKARPAPTCAA